MAAENKRQSMSGKAGASAAANLGPSGMVSLETALSGAVGARIRVTTASPTSNTLEGTLFTACPITNLIAINTSSASATSASTSASTANTQPGDYHIIPISRIQTFQLLSLAPPSTPTDQTQNTNAFTNAGPALHALDIRALKNREAAAISQLQERELRRGKGVSREAQDLFDAFSRTMPARWDGSNIVVADAVTISKPYRVEDCRAVVTNDAAALMRVRKVLEMERKKIELRNASAVIGNSGSFNSNKNANSSNNNNSATGTGSSKEARSAAVAVPNNIPPPGAASGAGQRKGG
ncbi:hypothetical protein FQN54_006780 [Arachnomyces sp. PD_36]|nr:hypothetical protein FQN54_006780 [Arachnomyces sp. PD_36]